MSTVGPMVSTVHVQVAAGPVLLAASVARTANVCAPSTSDAYATPRAHDVNAAPSSAHA